MDVDVKLGEDTTSCAKWSTPGDLAIRQATALASEKAPCRVPVDAPGLACMPDAVLLAPPEPTRAFFLRFVEMNDYLRRASSHLSEKRRHQIAMLCLCHLSPWSTLISPAQLYVVLSDLYPDVLSQIAEAFNAAFHDERAGFAAILLEESARIEAEAVAVREDAVREKWQRLRQDARLTEPGRWNAIIEHGGEGMLAWCLLGCPDGRLSHYIEHGHINGR